MKLTAQQKKQLRELSGVDRVIFKKTGEVEFRRSFFYTHGYDAQKLAASIQKQLASLGLEAVVLETYNNWQPWPRESYWRVITRLQQAAPALSSAEA